MQFVLYLLAYRTPSGHVPSPSSDVVVASVQLSFSQISSIF